MHVRMRMGGNEMVRVRASERDSFFISLLLHEAWSLLVGWVDIHMAMISRTGQDWGVKGGFYSTVLGDGL